MVLDIEKYSTRSNSDHLAMQPQLRKITEATLSHAQVPWAKVEVQNRGDGLLLELPPGIDEPRVIPRLVNGLCQALHQANRRTLSSRQMRLRMALAQGIRHPGPTGAIGEALIAACRLVDCAAIRDALGRRPERGLGLIVSDDLYHDVIAQRYPGLDPAEFTAVQAEVEAKDFTAKAWVHVPVPGDEHLLAAPRPRLLDGPAARKLGGLARDLGMQTATTALGGVLGEAIWQHHQGSHPVHSATGHVEAGPGGGEADDLGDGHAGHDGDHGDATHHDGGDIPHHDGGSH
jgi:hypothetical protein